MHRAGSAQVGFAKQFFAAYPWSRLEPLPAAVAWGVSHEARAVFNRRYHMKSGPVITNPGYGNPEVVRPAGPTDDEVGVLGLRCAASGDGDGSWLGALAGYALHYIGVPGDDHSLSADYFGEFARQLPAMLGAPCLAALGNGCSGDINNLDVIGGQAPNNDGGRHTARVAGLVAAAAQWALLGADSHDDAPLAAALREVPLLPRPAPSRADVARAAEIDARGWRTMAEGIFAAQVRRDPILYDEPRPTALTPTWVQAMRIGDLAIVGLPGEVFCGLGLEIKRRSPFAHTLILELANDSIGYLPTRAAFHEGGYEPASCDWLPGCGETLVEAAVVALGELGGA